jgi:hypothetical protein
MSEPTMKVEDIKEEYPDYATIPAVTNSSPPPTISPTSYMDSGDSAVDIKQVLEMNDDREILSNYCNKLIVSPEVEKWAHILFEKVKSRNNACIVCCYHD